MVLKRFMCKRMLINYAIDTIKLTSVIHYFPRLKKYFVMTFYCISYKPQFIIGCIELCFQPII